MRRYPERQDAEGVEVVVRAIELVTRDNSMRSGILNSRMVRIVDLASGSWLWQSTIFQIWERSERTRSMIGQWKAMLEDWYARIARFDITVRRYVT